MIVIEKVYALAGILHRQIFNYIHHNPVRAGFCILPEAYKYSSASFYYNEDKQWDFLTHYEG